MIAPLSLPSAAAALAALWMVEGLSPFFVRSRSRYPHAALNLTLGALSAGVRSLFFPAALVAAATYSQKSGLSFLSLADAPPWATWVLAVPLLDFGQYAWHIASHRCPLLWRFHCVHHNDDAVDSTTAFRFHAGDAALTSAVTLLVVFLFGLSVGQVLLYEALVLPASIFHHGNIRLPVRIERWLGAIIVTPSLHRVHHSQWVTETDSNYAALFSFWDRIFGTLRRRDDGANVRLGLEGYGESDHRTLRGCLTTPFTAIKSLDGVDTRDAFREPDAPPKQQLRPGVVSFP